MKILIVALLMGPVCLGKTPPKKQWKPDPPNPEKSLQEVRRLLQNVEKNNQKLEKLERALKQPPPQARPDSTPSPVTQDLNEILSEIQ